MEVAEDYTNAIRKFVAENFLFGQGEELSETQSFLDSGLIDSTGVLELVTFLENTYKIRISDAELIPDNLDSIHSISNYLRKKLER